MQTQLVAESETQLISQAQAGNREAFGELVRCFHSGVVNVVFRMCGDAALAEDAAQTAFIQAWRHLAGYQPRTSFRSWLYRIAVNGRPGCFNARTGPPSGWTMWRSTQTRKGWKPA